MKPSPNTLSHLARLTDMPIDGASSVKTLPSSSGLDYGASRIAVAWNYYHYHYYSIKHLDTHAIPPVNCCCCCNHHHQSIVKGDDQYVHPQVRQWCQISLFRKKKRLMEWMAMRNLLYIYKLFEVI